ncbi:hypothetical protein ACFYYP_32575 [Microbispora rosea]|uniref:hypothetical protein n=1 Tax=Microbispora rosea TaxID=58117 RepID=UPI0036804FBE
MTVTERVHGIRSGLWDKLTERLFLRGDHDSDDAAIEVVQVLIQGAGHLTVRV